MYAFQDATVRILWGNKQCIRMNGALPHRWPRILTGDASGGGGGGGGGGVGRATNLELVVPHNWSALCTCSAVINDKANFIILEMHVSRDKVVIRPVVFRAVCNRAG